MRIQWRVTTWLFVALGCSSGIHEKPAFMPSVRSYHDALRWDRIPVAAAHVPPKKRSDFLEKREILRDDFRIDDYEIVRVEMEGTGVGARLRVRFTWHSDRKGVVHTTTTEQLWEHKTGTWYLAAENLIRGPKMPGVAPKKEVTSEEKTKPPT